MRRDGPIAEQLAWAAGLFEGEGTITMCGPVFTAQLKNTDESVIHRFLEIIDLATVYGPYTGHHKDGFNRKPYWNWMAREEIACEALERLAPWLSRRRLERARELTGFRFHVFYWDMSR